MAPPISPGILPLKPFLARFAHSSSNTDAVTFPYHPSPRITRGPRLLHVIPKLAHFKAFFELVCAHVGPKWLHSLKRNAPLLLHPSPITPPSAFLADPLCRAALYVPKLSISRFSCNLYGLMGGRWFKIALKYPKRCPNKFERSHFGPLRDPPLTPVTLGKLGCGESKKQTLAYASRLSRPVM